MNKNIFNGFKTVFSFTAEQTIKGKGFKFATIGLCLLMFAIMAAMNVIIMFVMKEDEDKVPEEPLEEIVFEAENIYVFGKLEFEDIKDSEGNTITIKYSDLDVAGISKDLFEKEVKVYEGILENVKIEGNLKDEEIVALREAATEFLKDKEKSDAVMLFKDSEGCTIVEYLCESVNDNDGTWMISEEISDAIKKFVVEKTGLTEEYIQAVNREYMVQSLKAGEEEDIAVFLIKMIAPMMVCLILYMIVLLNGQSITKAIMAEKTSKLMETLLTSASPYAVVAGKVVAMASIAIGQMLLWIAGGVGGYFAGNAIAKSITPGFENPINEVLEVIKEGAESAFSIEAVIIALLFMIIGFFMYCILAAFASSFANKAEDMTNVAYFFQLPVVASFLLVYLAPLSGNEILLFISRYVPFTSPFGIPSDVMIGNVSILESIISLAIVVITMVVLVIATGKVYKDRVFNK